MRAATDHMRRTSNSRPRQSLAIVAVRTRRRVAVDGMLATEVEPIVDTFQ
jgi:hypothetical protein